MKHFLSTTHFIALTIFLISCKNRSLQDNEEFKPREIHSDIEFHFDRIEVDGIDYLILEKDNNNPHEGFGFMAFRANKMMIKIDTLLATNRTIIHMLTDQYAKQNRITFEQARYHSDTLLNFYLSKEAYEMSKLESSDLNSTMVDRDSAFIESQKK